MKKLFLLFALTALLPLVSAAPRITVEPFSPVAGEVFMIVLEIDSTAPPEFRMPAIPGVKISSRVTSTRSSTSIINGNRTVTASYGFSALAERPGKYTIPEISVTCDGKTSRTEPFVITVRDPADLTSPDGSMPDRVAAVMRIVPERQLYAGETAKLLLELIVPQSVQLGGIREITESGFADALFLLQGRTKSKFIQSDTRRTAKNGIGYTIYEFTAWFQVQKSGTFQPECRLLLQTTVPGNGGMFDSFFGVTKDVTVRAKTKNTLTVVPLPPVPDGVIDTGLVGSWQIDGSLPAEISGGKVAELTLEFTGNVPVEKFTAPEISIPHCRLYPAGVKARANGFTVQYPFVPLKPGKVSFSLPLAFFDPGAGKWVTVKRTFTTVVPAENMPQQSVTPPAVQTLADEPAAAKSGVREFPFYPREGGSAVKLPLIENRKMAIYGFLLLGFILFTAGFVRRFAGDRKSASDRRALRKKLRALADEISKSGDASGVLHLHGLTDIALALGLPAGATAQEISRAVSDPELAKFFNDLDSGSFAPGAPAPESVSGRNKLLNFLKNFSVLLILGCCLSAYGNFQKGRAEYDRGNFAKARELFAESVDPVSSNPNAVFNIGCPAYMLGDYPAATLAFEQALLLAPGDAGFQNAFQDSRSRIAGSADPGADSFGTFIASLRDRVRPDTYLLWASIAFAVLGGICCCRKFPGKKVIALILTVFMVLCVTSAATQMHYRYNPRRAMVVTAQAELHRLPGNSGSVAAVLPGGSEVMIVRQNQHWVQVTTRTGQDGWLPETAIKRIFPHGVW